MPLEKPGYREVLERIIAMYPGKEVLNQKEVAAFIGKQPRYVAAHFPMHPWGITIAVLARELC